MSYTQLTCEQRYQIYSIKKMGGTQTQIAEIIGVHKSTISRELRRNKGQRGYRPKQAHQKALERRNKAKTRISKTEWELVDQKIEEDWSPEQISSKFRSLYGIRISHEWIYQHIREDKGQGGEL